MTTSPARLWTELRERGVVRVGLAWAIAAWVVIQVTDAIAPAVGLPEWTTTLVVVLGVVGLVPALALAWAFDRAPGGTRRAQASPEPTVTSEELTPPARSIAVLPFVNFSGNTEHEYFSDGITEELIDRLVKVGGLQVAARTSSFAFKGRNADVGEIARQLRVAHVLEGSVRRSGDRLRVTAQLIDASSGFHVWSESYERLLADVFAIQDEIGQAIVSALRPRLQPGEVSSVPGSTRSVHAYDLYLQGRYLLGRRTTSAIRSAIERFEMAIACDGDYARAHAGLAEAYLILGSATHAVMAAPDALARARAGAQRALALDPALPDGHVALGLARLYSWDWSGSLEALRRAVSLDPTSGRARHHLAWRLAMSGDFDEALAAIEEARRLEPLSLPIRIAGARILHFMRRPEEAVAEARATLDLEPAFVGGHLALGLALLQQGSARPALAALQRARELSNTAATAALVAYALGAAGEADEGNAIVADLVARARHEYVSPEAIAGAMVGLGRLDEALDWYEQACAERSPALIYVAVEPLFDPVREMARFRTLVRNVGLEERAQRASVARALL